MPRKKEHDAIEGMLLGKVTPMSELMDKAHEYLGSHHRSVFHSAKEVIILAKLAGGDFFSNVKAGLIHLAVDRFFDEGSKNIQQIRRDTQRQNNQNSKKTTSSPLSGSSMKKPKKPLKQGSRKDSKRV